MPFQGYYKYFAFIIFVSNFCFADHPNEGKQTIDQLIKEAETNNLELRQAEESIQSSEYLLKSLYGRYFPAFFIQSETLNTKLDSEKNSGTSFYGKSEWNLYNGGSHSAEIEKVKIAKDFQQKKLMFIKSKIHRDITRLYYEMLFVLESIALKERAISMNAEQMKMAIAKKNSGFTSEADVIEFELRESTLKSDLILLHQEREQKSRQLDVALSRKTDSGPIDFKGHLTHQEIHFDRDQSINNMTQNNLELAEIQTEIASSELDKKILSAELLPRLDIEAKFGKLSNEEKIYQDNDNYSVMLKATIPIFSGLSSTNSQRALLSNLAGKKMILEQKLISMVAELDMSLSQIKALHQRLAIEEKNLNRSEEYYKITLSEYKRGVKNSPDMVTASERLLDTRIRNLEYRRDLMLAYLKVHELTNSSVKPYLN